jgi:uracil phosphoribosyltransferase
LTDVITHHFIHYHNDRGAKRLVVVAALGSRAGLEALLLKHPQLDIFVGAVDDTLSGKDLLGFVYSYILAGNVGESK